MGIETERWVNINGSIFTEKTFPLKIEFNGQVIQVRKSIAFNIKLELATYIVKLHNDSLSK